MKNMTMKKPLFVNLDLLTTILTHRDYIKRYVMIKALDVSNNRAVTGRL